MARSRRRGRPVNGIFLLDKPHGLSSNAALQRVKTLFDARKAGHTGSLDPLATGMLPICLGEATKVSAYLLDANKTYQVTGLLGRATATGDAEGDDIEACPVPADYGRLLSDVIPQFTGAIEQVPPMYSALKHQGKRLYELAREGMTVERPPRPVTIYALKLLSIDQKGHFALEVSCSKGTYIRTLVEDIARAIGSCAHVTILRRLSVGVFPESGMMTIEQLDALAEKDSSLLPLDTALSSWPAVTYDRDTAFYLKQGQAVRHSECPNKGWVRLYEQDAGFIGMGEALEDGRIAPKRLIVPHK